MTVIKIWYHDHHEDKLGAGEVETKVPKCTNMNMGEVVYEDDEWIRLLYGISGIGLTDEEHETVNIRKADIIRKE